MTCPKMWLRLSSGVPCAPTHFIASCVALSSQTRVVRFRAPFRLYSHQPVWDSLRLLVAERGRPKFRYPEVFVLQLRPHDTDW